MLYLHSKTYYIKYNIYESDAKLHHIDRYPLQIRVFTLTDADTPHPWPSCRRYLDALTARFAITRLHHYNWPFALAITFYSLNRSMRWAVAKSNHQWLNHELGVDCC